MDILVATPGRLVEHLSGNTAERGGAGALHSHKLGGGCGDCDADGSRRTPGLCLHDLAFLVSAFSCFAARALWLLRTDLTPCLGPQCCIG